MRNVTKFQSLIYFCQLRSPEYQRNPVSLEFCIRILSVRSAPDENKSGLLGKNPVKQENNHLDLVSMFTSMN